MANVRRSVNFIALTLWIAALMVSAVQASDAATETLNLRVSGMMKSRSGAT